MSTYVIIGTPGAFDFEAFGLSTEKTLALLALLVDLQDRYVCSHFSNSDFTELAITSEMSGRNEILHQVRAFAKAIRLGIEAAKCGFTAMKEILTLTELIDSTTIEDRQKYLQGTLKLADEAYSKAQEAFQALREIRTKNFSVSGVWIAMSMSITEALVS